ncbi:hypothetical protein BDB00DRAFT_932022 [Zychaea mexicana]|uniref:uncharacterized protein n=1 Tax=Zychaea mexicana TaxID=64656 RepID=UPI0022FE2A05|nr:uncharacterized protein BDB00DRAFT_932022 [Zychaea mexicana]KAI9489438.1 hypothetical protein BDB00DRAFT_932022 [Zychaea mexicana]
MTTTLPSDLSPPAPAPPPPKHAPTTYYMAPEHAAWEQQSPIETSEKGGGYGQPYAAEEGTAAPATSKQQPPKRPPLTERNRCVRWLCCACCLPVWARWIVWFIIIAIIILIIIFAALLATFTMPTMDFAGVTSSPTNQSEVSYDGHVLSFNFGLIIHVQNPNVLGIDLSQINATAYYPDNSSPNGKLALGGGYMDHHYVESNSNANFTFPFAINYDPFSASHTTILNVLIDKCGLTGGEAQDLTVDYTINLAAKVLFVKVHPTISSSATFKCPLTEDQGLPGFGGGSSSLGGMLG